VTEPDLEIPTADENSNAGGIFVGEENILALDTRSSNLDEFEDCGENPSGVLWVNGAPVVRHFFSEGNVMIANRSSAHFLGPSREDCDETPLST
jgi:hypothetical protein